MRAAGRYLVRSALQRPYLSQVACVNGELTTRTTAPEMNARCGVRGEGDDFRSSIASRPWAPPVDRRHSRSAAKVSSPRHRWRDRGADRYLGWLRSPFCKQRLT